MFFWELFPKQFIFTWLIFFLHLPTGLFLGIGCSGSPECCGSTGNQNRCGIKFVSSSLLPSLKCILALVEDEAWGAFHSRKRLATVGNVCASGTHPWFKLPASNATQISEQIIWISWLVLNSCATFAANQPFDITNQITFEGSMNWA